MKYFIIKVFPKLWLWASACFFFIMNAIKRIKINCPKCDKDFYLDSNKFKLISDLKYGISKVVLHCVCKKCKVKLEVEVWKKTKINEFIKSIIRQ